MNPLERALDLLAALLAACCLACPSDEGLVEGSPPLLAASEVLVDRFAEEALVVEEEGLEGERDLDLFFCSFLSLRLSFLSSRDLSRLVPGVVLEPELERDFDLDLEANRRFPRCALETMLIASGKQRG